MIFKLNRRKTTIITTIALLVVLVLAGSPAGLSTGVRAGEQKSQGTGTENNGSAPAAAQGRTVTYTYDAAGRLVGVNYGTRSIAYTYDKAGNLVKRQAAAGATVFVPMAVKGYGP